MATKEDILEQLVEEYLVHLGYFVQHNIKYRPRPNHPDYVKNLDSNHSDIDVLGFNPHLSGPSKVWAVSCKSWQYGFNPASEIKNISENKVVRNKPAWKAFRELAQPKWSDAFAAAIKSATGSSEFTHVLAVAKLVGDKRKWETRDSFAAALNGNPLRIITFREMAVDIDKKLTTTLAATEVGRMLQMFRAAGIKIED